jgi:hypothetical protein
MRPIWRKNLHTIHVLLPHLQRALDNFVNIGVLISVINSCVCSIVFGQIYLICNSCGNRPTPSGDALAVLILRAFFIPPAFEDFPEEFAIQGDDGVVGNERINLERICDETHPSMTKM